MAVVDFRKSGVIGHGEVEDMFADPAGELLDRPVIAVRDHRRDIHRGFPFHFDVKGELLLAVLCCQKFSSATSFAAAWAETAGNKR